MKKLSIILVFLAGFGLSAFSQQSTATVSNASATAKIIAPIALTNPTALNFGAIIPSASAGTAILSTANARSITGGVTLGNSTGVAAASFNVSGQANATYAITLPADNAVKLSNGTPADDMALSSWNSSLGATGTLDGTGAQNFKVGATVSVAANQTAGNYSATYSVSVNYN